MQWGEEGAREAHKRPGGRGAKWCHAQPTHMQIAVTPAEGGAVGHGMGLERRLGIRTVSKKGSPVCPAGEPADQRGGERVSGPRDEPNDKCCSVSFISAASKRFGFGGGGG